ncbi:MAG TPA: D-amino acid dehydrogenase [Alphaproteobacteria bacterium]|nr:D-amino acid dehydrogenase [Alphaproteobacteria bacterium]
MRVVVCGSGVIGVASAYYLARSGHDVVVVDRRPGPGLETSFANAGQISWGYATPWAAPGIPLKAVKWLLSEHSPLIIRPRLDPAQWRWLLAMLRNCTSARYQVNKERMLRLAVLSHAAIGEIRRETGISYDDGQRGTLQLFRTQEDVDKAERDCAILRQSGVPHRLLDRAECLAREPALKLVGQKIAGGLHLPGDETGDCFKFTNALAAHVEQAGVEFKFNTSIKRLHAESGRITHVETDAGPLTADAYLVALGSQSPFLLGQVGIRIPVYPVKGYSATVPVADPAAAPVSTIMDEAHKVAVTRLGDRIRAAGTAELNGHDTTLAPPRCTTISHVLRDLFPAGGDMEQIKFWTGLRPMTPDGPPVVGRTKYDNLYLNTGHGTLGWTMACGSGRLAAEIVSGHETSIDVSGLTVDRYGR